jgi:hypothetical protein
MPPKNHSDPEQGEGEESIVTICFCLLVHFVVFKYFLQCKALSLQLSVQSFKNILNII